MFAADLAHACQTVAVDCDAAVAARLLAISAEPYLVLVDSNGEPCGLVPAQELLRHLLPDSLALHVDLFSLSGPFAQAQRDRALGGRTLGDLLTGSSPPLTVTPDTDISQVFIRVTRTNSPAAVVLDRTGERPRVRGIVTAQRMLRVLLEEHGRQPDDLQDSVSAVLTASRLLVAVSARSLAEVEESLTLLQFRLMVVLGVNGAATAPHLADLMGAEVKVVRRLVGTLSSSGLLQPSVQRRDNAGLAVVLSPRGQDLVHNVTRRRMEAITRILESMPDVQRTALASAMRSFAKAAGEPSAELLAATLHV
ncbi:CBS domain-containing protein [Streptomyces sp. NPDC020607]|uniref:CBS domain-containing protein n=1 Tax=Streptomyces sp. NPDC020607 TaxID=3365082 RepID=UPI0037BDBD3A